MQTKITHKKANCYCFSQNSFGNYNYLHNKDLVGTKKGENLVIMCYSIYEKHKRLETNTRANIAFSSIHMLLLCVYIRIKKLCA